MSVDKAKAYYSDRTARKKLNCSQAVVAAFKDRFSLDDNTVALFAAYGSGMAPGGMCGALYAAKFLLKDKYQDRLGECEEAFQCEAGATKCKEIRKLRKLPCLGCVETAAKFIEKVDGKCAPAGSAESCSSEMKCSDGLSMEGQVRLIAGIMVLAGIMLGWFVHWAFIFISVFVGCGLIYAGLTDNCLMSIVLLKLPYNTKGKGRR